MNNFILPLLMGAPPGGEGPAGSGLMGFIPFILIIFIFYMFIIRPQSKKRKETEAMLSSLKKGDKIITIGGLHGTIQTVKETTIILKVDDNVKLEFLRSAVATITAAAKDDKDGDEKWAKGTGFL